MASMQTASAYCSSGGGSIEAAGRRWDGSASHRGLGSVWTASERIGIDGMSPSLELAEPRKMTSTWQLHTKPAEKPCAQETERSRCP